MNLPSRRWESGLLYNGGALHLPPGFRAGDGVFETIRTYDGRPFRLSAHVARLLQGAAAIGLRALPGPDRVEREILRALSESQRTKRSSREWVLRPAIFAEAPGWGFVVTVEYWSSPPRRDRASGLRVGTSRTLHPGPYLVPPSTPVAVKWIARGPLSHALREGRGKGWEEALLCDPRGQYIEGTRSNLILFTGRALVAPGPRSGALPGITREAVVECAIARGYCVEDRPIPPSELLGADALFLTSTLLGLSLVGAVDGHRVSQGRGARSIAHLLQRDLERLIQADTTPPRRFALQP
jgi:branched-chain amino acid aminotransferase